MNENTRTPPSVGTSNLKFPSMSVVVPVVVPCRITLTPGSPLPSSSDETVPDIVLSWAHKLVAKNKKLTSKILNISIFSLS